MAWYASVLNRLFNVAWPSGWIWAIQIQTICSAGSTKKVVYQNVPMIGQAGCMGKQVLDGDLPFGRGEASIGVSVLPRP